MRRHGWLTLLLLGCGTNDRSGGAGADDAAGESQWATVTSTGSSTTGVHQTSTFGEPTRATVTTAGPTGLPDIACPDPVPVSIPVPALGCTQLMLLDDNDEPTNDPSGVVSCGSVLYRTAEVPCPTDDGECRCDAQCGASQICLCAAEGMEASNRCLFADCKTADDCTDGYCRFEENGCSLAAQRCSSPSDDCVSNSDCVETGFCGYDPVDERFTCDNFPCHAE